MTPSNAITALISAGWTEAGIAEEVGTSQPTINRIRHGAQPRFQLGTDLLALYGRFQAGEVGAPARERPPEAHQKAA